MPTLIDLHCHILPGIDDGPQTLEESVAMCRAAAEDGICTIAATPHRYSNYVRWTSVQEVLTGVAQLNAALRREAIPLEVIPGQELTIHPDLLSDVQQGQALTYNNKRKALLLELPSDSVPFFVADIIVRLKAQGITPIIAHPERNSQIQSDWTVLKALVAKGAVCQLTSRCLTGDGEGADQICGRELLQRGLVHILASDAHSSRRPPQLSAAVKEAAQIIGEEKALAMATSYAQTLIS